MNKNRDDKILIYIIMALIVDFIGHYKGDKILIIISIGFILSIMLFTTSQKHIKILFICLPFFNLLAMKVGETSFFYMLMCICILKIILDKIKKHEMKDLIKKYLIIVFIVLCTIRNMFEPEIKKYIIWLIFTIFFIFVYKDKNVKLKSCINWFTLSFIISSILGYIAIINNLIQMFPVELGYVWNDGNIVLRFVGLMGETNGYAQVDLILISMSMINIVQSKNFKELSKYILTSVILIIFGCITYSKMFIIGFTIIITLLILYYLYKNVVRHINIKRIYILLSLLTICTGLLTIFISKYMDSELISNYLIRFSSEDLSTGRFQVYRYFIDFMESSTLYTLFGIGFYNYLIPWNISDNTGICAHNVYLECSLLFGIIGLLPILILVTYKIKGFIREKKCFILFIPLIIFFITGLSLHSMLTNYFYFIILIIFKILESDEYVDKYENSHFKIKNI